MPPEAVTVRIDDSRVQAAVARFPEAMQSAGETAVLEAVGFLEGEVAKASPVAHGFLAGSIFSELRGGEAEGAIRGIVAVNPPADRYALPVETGRKAGKRPPIEALVLWLKSPKMKAAVQILVAEITERRAASQARLSGALEEAYGPAGQGFRIAPTGVSQQAHDRELLRRALRKKKFRNLRGVGKYKRSPEEEAERSLAFLIARKIGREGTKGAFMFQNAYERNRDRILAFIRERLSAASRRAFGEGGGPLGG
jgi:hypothetical protein